MASFEVAIKANLAAVLPSLLVATHLEHNSLLPTVSKTFHDGATLADNEAIQISFKDGKILTGNSIVRYLGEFVDNDDNTSSQRVSSVQEWIGRSEKFLATDFKTLRNSLYELNSHLTLRSFIVGYSLSVADLAVWATIRGNRISHAMIKQAPIQENALRWYKFIEESNLWLSETILELTSFESKERAAASAAEASSEIELPCVDGPIVTRFPPEPSGYLHIGHAKAALLNDFFAHKSTGTLICRFDDTNPSKESMEFQDAILEDLRLMGISPDKVSHSSDYFETMYGYALQLIRAGKAFADDSELGKGDEDRKNRRPSKRRDLSIEETLKRFAEMKLGSDEGRRWCIRARIAYDSPNGTLRDPVIYRCNLIPHHRTGANWKMYPTYDFCAPILDSLEGINLALRTNEYRDRNAQYEWMQEALGLRQVTIWDFSRLAFVRTVLSKRKLTRIVNNGRVWGWDDPRMPTIRGIMRRGMRVPALREFILRQGPSRNILNLELGNKTVVYHNTILLEQVDAQSLKEDEEITLMNWGNAYVRRITRVEQPDEDAKPKITGMDLELHLEGHVKKTKKISWLAAVKSNMIPIDLVSFDYLITKDKLEKEDNLESFLASDTEFRTEAYADCNMADLPRGSIIQFERKGYYKLDVEYKEGEGSRMGFFDIPSGKA